MIPSPTVSRRFCLDGQLPPGKAANQNQIHPPLNPLLQKEEPRFFQRKTTMKKPCPDLTALSDSALRDFWSNHQPDQLKRLGDRLLAESLPRVAPRSADFYPTNLESLRQQANLSQAQMALRLGITPAILAAWEGGQVRPPASLPLIYERLKS